MIQQEKDYIARKKKKYLTQTIIWSLGVACIFLIGLIVMGNRESYFTVFAGVMVMGVALNLSRWIGYRRFQDGNVLYAQSLEEMKGSYILFHSAIIPDVNITAYFEHIIVTTKNIYILSYDEERIKKHRIWLENKLQSKGLELKQIHFILLNSLDGVKNIVEQVEKDTCSVDEELKENAKIINDLLM